MNTIRLYAVREDDLQPTNGRTKFRRQVLGSVLLWAARAKATRIVFDPLLNPPFQYFDGDDCVVDSQFSQPPIELREGLTASLFLDTIDGHPILRPVRRWLRRIRNQVPAAIIKIPDFEHEVETVWRMTVGQQVTTIQLLDTMPFHGRNMGR